MLRSQEKRLHVAERLRLAFSDRYPLIIDPRGARSIHPMSNWSLGPAVASAFAGGAWPAANRAIFIPFRLPVSVKIDKLTVGCGSNTGGNFDAGVYDAAGNRKTSTGSIARQAGVPVTTSVTAVYLSPGLYYLALAANGTDQYNRLAPANVGHCKLLGMRQAATSFTLPSTVTYATVSSAFIPFVSARVSLDASDFLETRTSPRWPPLNTISVVHPESMANETVVQQAAGIGAWTGAGSVAMTANLALYYPFTLQEPALLRKMLIIIGTGTTGNLDLGVYDAALNKVVSSGSTALGTGSTLQEVDVTDTLLQPGLYFMAMQFSSSSGSCFAVAEAFATSSVTIGPYYQQAVGSFGLPSTATFADNTASQPLTPALACLFDTLT